MSNLEPGCKAIVVKGAMLPHLSTNVGKIVTVGKFIGNVFGKFGADQWEVDKPMVCTSGKSFFLTEK